ncbi:MAG: hypothetical protein AB8G15_07375 [Saprospiraceae bacterium]
MKTTLLFKLLFVLSFSLKGQTPLDCSAVLEPIIYFEDEELYEAQQEIIDQFSSCYLDTIDIKIFWDGAVLGVFLVALQKREEDCNFNNLLELFKDFKVTPAYRKRRAHYLKNQIKLD